jgi:hypothetical protein
MSLIVDINPVPWKILDLVRARILKNRAKKAKKGTDWSKDRLKREMSLQSAPLLSRRKDEPSLILSIDLISITIEYSWQTGADLDTVTSMTEPVADGPLGFATERNAKYITWTNDNTTDNGTEAIILGRPKSEEAYIPESKQIDTFLADYPSALFVRFSLAANWFSGFGNEIVVRVKINAGEEDETIILEEIKVVTLLEQGGPGQSLGILEISLDGSYAKFL